MTELVTNDKQAMKALKQHGNKIITAIALVLAVFFGWQFYQKNYAKIDTAAADKYTAISQTHEQLALLMQNPDDVGNTKETQDNLYADIDALVTAHGNSVYAWQALMMKARHQSDADDHQGAAESLRQAIAVPINDAGLIAVAKLNLAQVLLAAGDTDAAVLQLNETMPEAFEASRQEILGDISVAKKDEDAAKVAYEKAWELLRARHESRALLGLKMQALGMDVTPITPKAEIISAPNATTDNDVPKMMEVLGHDAATSGGNSNNSGDASGGQ